MTRWSGCISTSKVARSIKYEAAAGSRRTLRSPDQKMEPQDGSYIFTERNGIYIIDLQKTVKKLDEAYNFRSRYRC